ncbi:SMODS domain-containing nucleotidyltransferase [Streptomonospora salina]|uniref:SMODS domain-containing nucleotidyltransferase n=1 Tax=Streptomonospora salina TaxID=104205 RepID=UPI0016082DE5|nr:nucleotidyltransferase [Streptomonospora salina]
MKHVDYFKNFLNNSVNLSQTKLETLSGRTDAIYELLKEDEDLGPLLKKKIPQGSWPQKTIINPQNGKAFDGDFMVQMVEKSEWADNLKEYGDAVYNVLHKKSPYKDMPHGRKCRCVYVQYAENVMHVDIVPFVVRSDGTQWIINRDDNEWERTDTEGFTDWMKRKDEIANGHLREVVRIMKFLRDHKNSFTGTKSVLLTTMLGERVEEWRKFGDPAYYGDLPTALLHIISDLDVWLQEQTTKPEIIDPSGTGTSFGHRWKEETFFYFRDRIQSHAAEIKSAYKEPDPDKSLKKWQNLFGSGFKEPEKSTSSGKYTGTGAAGAASMGATTINHSGRAG